MGEPKRLFGVRQSSLQEASSTWECSTVDLLGPPKAASVSARRDRLRLGHGKEIAETDAETGNPIIQRADRMYGLKCTLGVQTPSHSVATQGEHPDSQAGSSLGACRPKITSGRGSRPTLRSLEGAAAAASAASAVEAKGVNRVAKKEGEDAESERNGHAPRARLTRGYPLRCYTLLVSLCVCVFAARLERRVGPKRCESARTERADD